MKPLLVLVVLCAACAGRPCDSSSCATGCCDANGACVEVPRASACGIGGAACVACDTRQSCVDGACKASGLGGGSGGLEPWQDELLTAHNRVRNNAMPAPSPALPALTWNAQAQAVAQAWVDRCTWGHNPAANSAWGENIYASTGTTTATQVVSDWAAEVSDYDYATNSCAPGKACGHYTQIVWRATTSVGCAMKECTANSPFGAGAWTYWVCDYAPPGNVTGQKPY
ncbi:MAG: CAP domain-containing protein [Myxococcota bacterium]